MEDIILKTYKRQRDSELITDATRVHEGMDGNPYFTDPPALPRLSRGGLCFYLLPKCRLLNY